jgi:membrane-bound serine protease (ClpP class)
LLALTFAGLVLLGTAGTAAAVTTSRRGTRQAAASGHGGITVVQLQGLIDPPLAALARHSIDDANAAHAALVLVQLDSSGALATDVDALVRIIEQSRVPVVVWVGPSGAQAAGGAALLAQAASMLYVSQGSSLGPALPVRLDEPHAVSGGAVALQLRHLASARGRNGAHAATLATTSLGAAAAGAARVTNGVQPTIGEVIVTLDGQTVPTAAGPVHLSTARVVGTGRARRRQPNQDVVFTGLGLGARLQHTLLSSRVTYLLLVAGLALIAFEFFAASVGFAAGVGALAFLGAGYGASHLPVSWWAAALIAAGIVAFSVDVQAGGLGFWTFAGGALLLVGSLTLYGGSSRLHVPWWELALVLAATLLFFVGALPAFVRSRYSTPTVGREGLVGELGEAEVAVDPDGVVVIRGSRWRARTNRATPIAAGGRARVVAVEGLVLEVEPEVGGARDHRERARSRRRGGGDAPR